MATIQQLDDLATAAISHLIKGNLAQMAQTMQHYEVMSKWFKKGRVKKLKGGTQIEHRVMTSLPDTSRFVHIDDTDNPSIPKLLDKITIPWCHHEDSYAWYVEEMLACSGQSEIVDLIASRRDATKIKTAEVFESAAWTLKDAADTKKPLGVPYWLPTNASASPNGEWSTALPSGYSDIGGLVPTSTNNWTHWNAVYSNVSASDLIRKIRLAMDQTKFVSPIGKEEHYVMKTENWRIYCGVNTKLDIEDVAVAQNESLGRDVASMDNMTTIRGNPLVRIPQLDNAPLSPIYGLNHNVFRIFVQQGRFFDESGKMVIPTNHRARVVYTDTMFNFGLLNRRTCWVMNKAA